jgi:uncharacterized protein (TIGR02996 family)
VTEETLLAAVLAAPDDDAPRLVYADWLADRGDPRGEYIQLACQAARVPGHAPQAGPLVERLLMLERTHHMAWGKLIKPVTTGYTFHRGFVEAVTLAKDLTGFDELARVAPVTSVTFLLVDDDSLHRIAASPHLAALRKLHLLGDPGPEALRTLASSRHLRPGVTIGLQLSLVTAERASGLAAGRFADRIGSINMIKVGADDATIAAIAALPGLESLVSLQHDLGIDSARALARAPRLAELMIESQRLGDEAGLLLAGIPRLKKLQLYRAGLTPAGTAALVARLPPSIRILDLSHNAIGDEGARAIADAPQLAGLVELHLRDVGLTAEGLRAIVRSPHLGALEYLWFDGAPEDPLRELADPAILPSLLMARVESNRRLGKLQANCPSLRRGRWRGSLMRVKP